MKNILFFVLLLTVVSASAQERIVVTLPIVSATVYEGGAQITQAGEVKVPAGVSTIIVKSILQNTESGTLQCAATGNVKILSIAQGIDKEDGAYVAQVKKLREQLEQMQDSVKNIEIVNFVLNKEKELLLVNRQVGGEAGIKVEELKKMADFMSARLTTVEKQLYNGDKAMAVIREKQARIKKEMDSLDDRYYKTRECVVVLVDVKTSSTTKLTVNYMVENASWVPVYDVRLSENSDKAQFNCKAVVKQQTSADWKDVNLVLSSGNPRVLGQVPVLYPYYLQPTAVVPVFAQKAMNNLSNTVQRGVEDQVDMELADENMETTPSESSSMVTVANISQSMNTANFIIKMPYTVQTGGEGSEVQVAEQLMPVVYEYITVPGVSQEALLVATIPEFGKYNLLYGEAALYLDNSFRGRQQIDRSSISPLKDVLNLSMGVDKNIIVKRVPKQNYTKSVSGGAVREERLWETTVRNNKNIPMKIKIEEQYPISKNSEIKVEDLSYTKENATVDEPSGKVTWVIALAPNASAVVSVGYTVKYPKKMTLWIR